MFLSLFSKRSSALQTDRRNPGACYGTGSTPLYSLRLPLTEQVVFPPLLSSSGSAWLCPVPGRWASTVPRTGHSKQASGGPRRKVLLPSHPHPHTHHRCKSLGCFSPGPKHFSPVPSPEVGDSELEEGITFSRSADTKFPAKRGESSHKGYRDN